MKMPLDFKKLVTARFFATFAVQMQSIVLAWRIYDLMKDPLYLGLIGLTEAVPAIGLALFAGYLIDRSRPLKVYRGVLCVCLLSGLILLSAHLFASHLTIAHQALMLYSASFLTGLARSFSQPSIYASVPRLVSREQLVQATAINSSAMQVARIGGPAVGGFIFGFLGSVTAASVVCVLLVVGLFSLLLIKADIAPPADRPRHNSIKDEFLSGIRFVFKHSILLPALSLDMVSVLFGGVTALLPIFAEDILHAGPKGLGLLRGAPAIGATLMSFYLARFPLKGRSGTWLFTAVTGFGVCIFIFGLSRVFWLSMAALAVSGAFDSISMLIRSSAVQLASPDHLRGKISAVNSIFIGSSNEIGEVESGLMAKLMGTVPSVYFGATMCLLSAGVIAYLSPKLRTMELEKLSD